MLVYETEPNFTSKTETVTNDAIISSEGAELPGKDTKKDVQVTIQESDGLAYGTKGKIIVQKENGQGESFLMLFYNCYEKILRPTNPISFTK